MNVDSKDNLYGEINTRHKTKRNEKSWKVEVIRVEHHGNKTRRTDLRVLFMSRVVTTYLLVGNLGVKKKIDVKMKVENDVPI